MKKIVLPLLVILLCIAFVGCSALGSVIQFSSNGETTPYQKVITPDSDFLALSGRLSVTGRIELKILAPDKTELYAETFEDVHNKSVTIELSGLTAGKDYELVLNREQAVSCNLSLTTEQKLVADVTRPAKQEK